MNALGEGCVQNTKFEASNANRTISIRESDTRQPEETQPVAIETSDRSVLFSSVTQGVVTAATGAGLTIVLRRAFTGNGMSSSILQGTESSSVTAAATATASTPTAATVTAPPAAAPAPPPPTDGKPAHDVVAGAVARAASQSTIHPLDTMKVRMQAGRGSTKSPKIQVKTTNGASAMKLERSLNEVRGLYKGVVGAATGAGIIIGTYFAFYSTTKRFLREKTELHEGASAFVAGATAALGSSVVKVPLAVCIRSVQAGVYKNVFHAAKSIVSAAGVRGLFTGFLPTVLEDVPDMAVKFAVYESLRKVHDNLRNGRPANVIEDLIMGGVAGAAAAAATTPLDVVKTVMMCTASTRPTLVGAAKSIMREGKGIKPFFRGVGPRALSNGLNSAIFFCFFEAIRQVLIKKQEKASLESEQGGIHAHSQSNKPERKTVINIQMKPANSSVVSSTAQNTTAAAQLRPAGTAAACLSLALPLKESNGQYERM